jgi:hypothetical protein
MLKFKWIIPHCERVTLIDQKPLIFNGIHGYFPLSCKQQNAFMSISLTPINHAINFILTFLPEKNTGYEINMNNHHNIVYAN